MLLCQFLHISIAAFAWERGIQWPAAAAQAKSKARRGQVQEARVPSGAYGGEATGIKAGVAKSRRF